MLTRPLVWLLVASGFSLSCSEKSISATTAVLEDDAGGTGADATDAASSDASQDIDPFWDDNTGCPSFASKPTDEYFPKRPLLVAGDFGPDVEFRKLSQRFVLADRRGTGEPLIIDVGSAIMPDILPKTFDLPEGAEADVVDIAGGPQARGEVAALVCFQDGCEVYVPPKQDADTLVAHALGRVPLPGRPETAEMLDIDGQVVLCVLGDGVACVVDDRWEIWIEPGSGPTLRAAAAGLGRVVFVGDRGRVVQTAPEHVESFVDEVSNLRHVTVRWPDGYVATADEPEPVIWLSFGSLRSSCPAPDITRYLAIREVNGVLHGVHSFGNPFQEMSWQGTLYWLDFTPLKEEDFHGELIDGDVVQCAAGLNYLGLQKEAVLGTMHCPMGC